MPADLKLVPLQPIARENAVAMARDLLARAESGEIQVLAAVALTADGGVAEGYTSSPRIQPFALMGALDALKQRVLVQEVQFS